MPRAEAADGTELHYEVQGEGPLVLLAPYWNHHPSAFEQLTADLAADHRVARYDARGTGESERVGPHDLETAAADMEAVIRQVSGPAVVLALADGVNAAVRVAHHSPEVITAVIGLASTPIGFEDLRASTDAMVTSDSVIEAFIEMLGRDYRGALRAVVEPNNPQMSDDELRERVQALEAYAPSEVAVARTRAWWSDDPLDEGRGTGDKLWVLLSANAGGPWLPPVAEMEKVIAKLLPEAHVETVEEGMVSRPDLIAAVVRRITNTAG
jgi:pimeloyl-ACP methyl ester carboxylesterase